MDFLFTEIFWKYVAGIIGGITTIWGIYVKIKSNKSEKSQTYGNIYKNLECSIEVESILKTMVSAYPDVVITSVSSVTNSDMPANIQVINSSDHDTFSVWSDKKPMEHDLRKAHVQMMLKGDEHFHISSLKNKGTQDWAATNNIKIVYIFNIGMVTMKLNGFDTDEQCHLVLYVNSSNDELKEPSFYNYCRGKANEINSVYSKYLKK